jgi:hypothetical protein
MKKFLRLIERTAHSIGLLLAIVAVVWIGVFIGRPAEKNGNQSNFAGTEQQKNLSVGGYLDLSGTAITEIPAGARIVAKIYDLKRSA